MSAASTSPRPRWWSARRAVLALALGVIIGLVFYSRAPQGNAPSEPATPQPGTACTVSDQATRATVAGPGARNVCLRFRDVYGLDLDAASAQAMSGLQVRCSYKDASGNVVTVEVSRAESTPAPTALAMCHDLATNPNWQVVQ